MTYLGRTNQTNLNRCDARHSGEGDVCYGHERKDTQPEEQQVTKSETRDNRNDQIDDADLDIVVGGSPIGGAIHNSGWVFKDIFAKPTLPTLPLRPH